MEAEGVVDLVHDPGRRLPELAMNTLKRDRADLLDLHFRWRSEPHRHDVLILVHQDLRFRMDVTDRGRERHSDDTATIEPRHRTQRTLITDDDAWPGRGCLAEERGIELREEDGSAPHSSSNPSPAVESHSF